MLYPKWGDSAEKEEKKVEVLSSLTAPISKEVKQVNQPISISVPTITIKLIGITGAGPTVRTVPYSTGANLGNYMRQVKLLNIAIKNAVYDPGYPTGKRCRMSYVPQKDSEIIIGPAQFGVFSHLQRGAGDKRYTGTEPKEGTLSLTYNKPKKKEVALPKRVGLFDNIEQV